MKKWFAKKFKTCWKFNVSVLMWVYNRTYIFRLEFISVWFGLDILYDCTKIISLLQLQFAKHTNVLTYVETSIMITVITHLCW